MMRRSLARHRRFPAGVIGGPLGALAHPVAGAVPAIDDAGEGGLA